MADTNDHASETRFRYLDAERIEGPFAAFRGLEVLDAGRHKVGSVTGVLVDPAERHVSYLVVQRKGLFRSRRYLLPLTDIRVDAGRAALVLEDETKLPLGKFEPQRYPAFSDDDLLTALFANRAA